MQISIAASPNTICWDIVASQGPHNGILWDVNASWGSHGVIIWDVGASQGPHDGIIWYAIAVCCSSNICASTVYTCGCQEEE